MKFQANQVGITFIGIILDVTTNMIGKWFLGGIIGVGAIHIYSFLIKEQGGTLKSF